MKKFALFLFIIFALTSNAQVKIGSNPTDINQATTNLQVEGETTRNQFVILKNGNIGIETTMPTSNLSFSGDKNIQIKMESRTNAGNGFNLNIGAGGSFGLDNSNGGSLNLMSGISKGNGTSSIIFSTAGSNVSGGIDNLPTEKMTISGKGNVGIGTTTPTSTLQVVGLPVHSDNTKALASGLTVGAFYHTGDGIVRVVF